MVVYSAVLAGGSWGIVLPVILLRSGMTPKGRTMERGRQLPLSLWLSGWRRSRSSKGATYINSDTYFRFALGEGIF